MTYRDRLQRLGDATANRVVAVFSDYAEGRISHDQAVALIAVIIAKANHKAVALADLSLAATLVLQLRRPVAPLGLLPPADDQERLATAATTLLAVSGLTVARVARLGRSEPLAAAANAYSEAIDQNPLVTGWIRHASPAACKVCADLADNKVRASSVSMWHHPGCTCTQQPVTDRKETQ